MIGMLSFKGERPAQPDALVTKNYRTEEELSTLNSVVSDYLEFAEMQARRRIPLTRRTSFYFFIDFL
ncbi:MAG TPA: RhuM family protein [Thermoclostridium sp.]|nr:RhuM family protein [Thermoclostridium sp.]